MRDCTPLEENSIRKDVCPDCGKKGFLEGPHGGLAVNIMCANPDCGSKFNDMGPFGFERISEPSPLKKKEVVSG